MDRRQRARHQLGYVAPNRPPSAPGGGAIIIPPPNSTFPVTGDELRYRSDPEARGYDEDGNSTLQPGECTIYLPNTPGGVSTVHALALLPHDRR
jgi:hypothetical protein